MGRLPLPWAGNRFNPRDDYFQRLFAVALRRNRTDGGFIVSTTLEPRQWQRRSLSYPYRSRPLTHRSFSAETSSRRTSTSRLRRSASSEKESESRKKRFGSTAPEQSSSSSGTASTLSRLEKGKATLKAATFDDLVEQLDQIKTIAVAGGLDEALSACANAVRSNFKAAKEKKGGRS